MATASRKIRQARDKLKEWNKTQFGYARTRIKELEKKIEEIQNRAPTQENLEVEVALCLELEKWLEWEEVKLKQKSRELWLKVSDWNSRFFHLSTIIWRQRNHITEIREDEGSRLIDRYEIGAYFATKFKEVFQSSNTSAN